MMIAPFLVFSLAGWLLWAPSCAPPSPSHPPGVAPSPYTFDRPDAVFELPRRLREISGLTHLADTLLGAVQDEEGRLYVLDGASGEVVREEKFGGKGDYEGVERVANQVYVLRSDGDLFVIEDWRAKDYDARRVKTRLSEKNDTEGLAYDPAHRRLLIACKEYPGKKLKGYRAIYAYLLEERRLADTPAYTLSLEALEARVREEHPLNRALRRLLTPVADLSRFKPSGLALHPVTGRLYVLSSVLKAIAVLTPDGALYAVWPLPPTHLPQPEGIAFLPEGDLFLASEGAGGRATLLRFSYHPPDQR